MLPSTTKCTQCGGSILSKSDVKRHPTLGVPQCSACHAYYNQVGDLTQYRGGEDINGQDNYCRWCLNGGDLICCIDEYCRNAFCKNCITRNLGERVCKEIEKSDDWSCFICEYTQLDELKEKVSPLIMEPAAPLVVEPAAPLVVEPTAPLVVEPTAPLVVEPTAPLDLEPATPVDVEPAAPVDVEPATPVDVEPAAPVDVEPATPVDVEPAAPLDVEPAAPSDVEPATPVDVEPAAPLAVDQDTPVVVEPAAPVVVEPAAPVVVEPATPVVDEPATPAVDEPVTPLVAKPVTPLVAKPVTPLVAKPATPLVAKPATPVVVQPKSPAKPQPTPPSTQPLPVKRVKSFNLFSSSKLFARPAKKPTTEPTASSEPIVTKEPTPAKDVVQPHSPVINPPISISPPQETNPMDTLDEELAVSDSDDEIFEALILPANTSENTTVEKTDIGVDWALRDANSLKDRLQTYVNSLQSTLDTFDERRFRASQDHLFSWASNLETFLDNTKFIQDRCTHLFNYQELLKKS